MRSLILKLTLNLIFILFLCHQIFTQEWAILPAAEKHPMEFISIIGETNINCFECIYTKIPDDQDIFTFALNYPQSRNNPFEVNIPVREFICNNFLMYNDFQSLLKTDEHPYIKIRLDPSRIQDISNKPFIDLNVSVTIAYITKIQSITCSVDDISGYEVRISGKTTIHLADYKIEPPVKFMGLVKVKDEVIISFSFNFIIS